MPSYFPSTRTRFGWERRRHPDPLSYLLDRYARSLDSPFGKRPRDWTTADFDALGEVLEEWKARERGRRRRRDSGDSDEFEPAFEGRRGSGRRRRRDDGDDDEFEPMFEGRRESGGDRDRDLRELLALLRAREQGRRLEGVENAVYGSPAERREAAFRERLQNVLNGRGGGGDGGGGGRYYGGGGGGGGGWGQGTRMAQQERDLERREREQRDREVEELRRELDRLRERDERDRERGPWW